MVNYWKNSVNVFLKTKVIQIINLWLQRKTLLASLIVTQANELVESRYDLAIVIQRFL